MKANRKIIVAINSKSTCVEMPQINQHNNPQDTGLLTATTMTMPPGYIVSLYLH